MASLLGMVGFAVLAYFTAHPQDFGPGVSLLDSADELLPRFLMGAMPAGLAGLVIAAILSAAMSSLSSGLNSSSAVIGSDFIDRLAPVDRTQAEEVHRARLISVGMGILAISLSTIVGYFAQNLMELCIKVVNLLTAPMFVLFFLALFVPRATPASGIVATIVSVSVAVGIAFFQMFGLEFLWTGPCALVAGCLTGVLVSYVQSLWTRTPQPREED